MPPVMITAVIPIATMATKAKLRVTLNRFCGVANESVANDRMTAASRAAASTQNACRPSTRADQPVAAGLDGALQIADVESSIRRIRRR